MLTRKTCPDGRTKEERSQIREAYCYEVPVDRQDPRHNLDDMEALVTLIRFSRSFPLANGHVHKSSVNKLSKTKPSNFEKGARP